MSMWSDGKAAAALGSPATNPVQVKRDAAIHTRTRRMRGRLAGHLLRTGVTTKHGHPRRRVGARQPAAGPEEVGVAEVEDPAVVPEHEVAPAVGGGFHVDPAGV